MPKLLKTPFAIDAAEGFRTDIQESAGAAPNSATYQVGFPPVTMQSIASNGMPPKGSDLNGVLYDITDNLVFLTQGGGYGFDASYATSIGGYPLNARLRLTNGDIVKSTIDGNTNDPNVDMTGWINIGNTSEVESIADLLTIQNPKNGNRVFVKYASTPVFGTNNPYVGGGDFLFITGSTLQADGYVVASHANGRWVKAITDITVDDFGAKGDGSTDDSDAFQRCADSPYSGHNVRLANRKAEYVVTKTIDLKTKGLVGGGVSRVHVGSYERNCISVKDGTFTNNFAFINLRKTLENVVIRDKTTTPKTLNCISLDAYDIDINNVVITDFYDQIYSKFLSVVFHVDRFHGIGAGNYPIHVLEDGGTADSTTSSFSRCHFYYCKGSIKYDKGVYNSSFKNIVVEYCDEGLTAGFFAGCTFDNLWFENTNTATLPELPLVIKGLTSQQSHNNFIGSINTNPKWKYLYDMGVPAPSNNFDGWGFRTNTLFLQKNTGGRMEITHNSIRVLPNEWFDNTQRNLDISAAEVASGSSRRSYLNLRANSGYIRFKDVSDTSTTPITISRQIGAAATANTPLFGTDVHTVNQKAATFTEIGSGAAGHFDSELILVWDSATAHQGKSKNGGWEIVKTDVGKYTLQRVSGNTQEMQSASLFISGVMSSSFLVHRVASAVNSYSGSWSGYRICAGYTIEFANASGVLTDPDRFSLSVTMRL